MLHWNNLYDLKCKEKKDFKKIFRMYMNERGKTFLNQAYKIHKSDSGNLI